MSEATTLTRPKFTRGEAAHRYSHEAHAVGPHSRPHSLARLDGRTKEGAVFTRVKAELTEYIGNPNIVERMIIERCAWLAVRLAMLDRKIEQGRDFTLVDSNTYLAWHNSFVRSLARLGIRPTQSDTSSVDAIMAELTR
jgi:hypothetical protein